MKSERGITLISLIVYVAVMLIVVLTMSMITNNFYVNISGMQGNVNEILEFNKFNMYFLKEIKSNNNSIDSINNNHILFDSGNSFYLSNNKIYYNNIAICNGVQEFNIKCEKDDNGNYNNVINAELKFEAFSKVLNYKLENIY